MGRSVLGLITALHGRIIITTYNMRPLQDQVYTVAQKLVLQVSIFQDDKRFHKKHNTFQV